MNNNISKTIARSILIANLILVGCTKEIKIIEKIPADSQTAKELNVSSESTANDIIQSAEQLFGPYTFMLSYKLATLALEKEPSNLKAQFYYLFLKRFEAFRGYLVRIKPLMNEKQRVDLEKSLTEQLPHSPLRDFLTDPSLPVFKNETDIQNALSQYFNSTNEFRKFLKNNEQNQIDIQINPYVFEKEIQKQLQQSCKYIENDGTWSLKCYTLNIATKKLNLADMIYLRQIAAGEVLYGALLNSYSTNGIIDLDRKDPQNKIPLKDRLNILMANNEFGKLRADSLLKTVKEIGSDLISATNWVIKNQAELCRKREGYLLDNGICYTQTEESQKNLDVLTEALSGIINLDLKLANDSSVKVNTQLDIISFLNSPISDLRTISPQAFNQCDKATTFKDNTLGGLFVENNASLFLLESNCR